MIVVVCFTSFAGSGFFGCILQLELDSNCLVFNSKEPFENIEILLCHILVEGSKLVGLYGVSGHYGFCSLVVALHSMDI